MRRKIDPERGLQAVGEVLTDVAGGSAPDGARLALATRFLLEELGSSHPGNTVEVRVPPYGAVQCLEGPVHTRGTPANVVECSPSTWVELATGRLGWADALARDLVSCSGIRADLSRVLPLAGIR